MSDIPLPPAGPPPSVVDMLKTDGIYVVSKVSSPLYDYVSVKAGVCVQLKLLSTDTNTGKAIFKEDGVLSLDGWAPDTVVAGPVKSESFSVQ